MSGFAPGVGDSFPPRFCPGGSKFGHQKMPEGPYPCFGFPHWFVQVEANLFAQQPNRILPNLATTEASSAGCRDTTAVTFSGFQTWLPTTQGGRRAFCFSDCDQTTTELFLRFERLVSQCGVASHRSIVLQCVFDCRKKAKTLRLRRLRYSGTQLEL